MNSFTQSLQDSMLIVSMFVAALFIACTVSLALRNYEAKCQIKKLKKWRKFSEIEKRQKHEEYDLLATELAEERAFNDTQGDIHVRLMLKYAAIQETSEKLEKETKEVNADRYQLSCENSELKREIEQYQDAVKDLRIEIDALKAKAERKRKEKGQFIKTESDAIQRIGRTKRQEKDWTTATKDELLAEAKRMYPVGTKYLDVLDNEEYTSRQNPWIYKGNYLRTNFGVCVTNGGGYVYADGQWAQIIP